MHNKATQEVSPIVDIAPDAVGAGYVAHKLHRWSDDRLVNAVASVISVPRQDPANSFVLHAPLELVARRRILQLIEPSRRHLARLHILALGVNYLAAGAALEDQPEVALVDPALADPALADLAAIEIVIERLLRSIATGDLDGVDQAATSLEADVVDPALLATTLAPPLLASTAAAAHAPIFLQYLLNAGRDGRALLPMIRPLARELARNPEWQIGWVDPLPAAKTPSADLYETLANAPRLGVPGSSFIHPIMSQVDTPDVARTLLPPALGGLRSEDAARSVLRVAAQSMVHDDPAEAAYGWTHCLTLPQAVLSLSSTPEALAIAATHVLGFRCALGVANLPALDLSGRGWGPDTPARIAALASAAAVRHDAHIVKYAVAVIDAAVADREATDLYLSAGERLIEVWDDNGGHPQDNIEQPLDIDV